MRPACCTLRPIARSRLHQDLASGFLYVNGTFTAGFLAGRPWGGRTHINALCFIASSSCFYSMLSCIDRMLSTTQARTRRAASQPHHLAAVPSPRRDHAHLPPPMLMFLAAPLSAARRRRRWSARRAWRGSSP